MSSEEQSVDQSADEPAERPLLRVVRGEPSPEELAALVSVVAARRAAAAEAARRASGRPVRSRWGHPALAVRGTHAPGPGAWRASALPR